jgi:hypothetical protein
MIKPLLEIEELLSKIYDRRQKIGAVKSQRISSYCKNIAECLGESAKKLKNNKKPTKEWAKLKHHAENLNQTIGEEVGEDAASELVSLLMHTANYVPRSADIVSLETAEGKFEAIAEQFLANPENLKSNTETDPPDPKAPQSLALQNRSRRRFLTYSAIATPSALSIAHLGSSKYYPLGQFPSVSWNMQTFLSNYFEKTILYDAPQQVCDRIRKMTNGRFDITLERVGTSRNILTKVSEGQIECGYSGIYYNDADAKVLYFGCAIPFGLNPQEQTAWLNYHTKPDDEFTYVQSLYKMSGYNIIPFPAGATGGQMGGWLV